MKAAIPTISPLGRATYPPPAGGGLIEGVREALEVAAWMKYPPPAGGGLIEGRNRLFTRFVDAAHIPRPRAGASLKAA